jgi:hypothetical protein
MNIFMRINPAIKYINDVILSNAKNLAFSLCYEILHCVQDDNDNYRVKTSKERRKTNVKR